MPAANRPGRERNRYEVVPGPDRSRLVVPEFYALRKSVLIHDRADRDEISSRLMRYRDQNGQGWADIIDFLTMYPDARRQAVRLLGEIQSSDVAPLIWSE
jgi:hypothetical protein